jgi:hypothetical protein
LGSFDSVRLSRKVGRYSTHTPFRDRRRAGEPQLGVRFLEVADAVIVEVAAVVLDVIADHPPPRAAGEAG